MNAAPATQPPMPSQPDPHQQLIQMMAGFWVSRAIQVAASLRLADHVDVDRPRGVDDLAAATGTHAPSLYRLMRALASAGVFVEDGARRFAHTPASRLLRSDEPGTMRAFFESVLGGGHFRAWGDIEHSVRTGDTAFDYAHGEDVWSYFAKHEREQRTFDQAMTDLSGVFNPPVVRGYDFSPFDTIIDVGGGHGALLAAVLKQHPKVRGVVFDQPHVMDGARRRIAEEGLAGRCEAVGGSFFESIPVGADACLMQFILHDWNDARCGRILANVRKALPAHGKLLVVETVLPAGNEPSLGKWFDLNMLAMTGGEERTEAEFATLFAASGFELVKVHPTESPLSIIEGRRR